MYTVRILLQYESISAMANSSSVESRATGFQSVKLKSLKRFLVSVLALLLTWGMHAAGLPQPGAGPDTSVIHSLYDSAKTYLFKKNQKVRQFSEQILSKSTKAGYAAGQAQGYLFNGAVFWSEMKWDSALSAYRQAADIALEHHLDDLLIRASGNLGVVFTSMNRPDSALLYLKKTVDYAREADDSKRLAAAWIKLGYAQKSASNFPEAAKSFGEALKLSEAHHDTTQQGKAHSAFGLVYTTIGDHNKALQHLKQAAALLSDLNNSESDIIVFSVYSNIAEIYADKIINRDSAFHYFELARQIVPESRRNVADYLIESNSGVLLYNLGMRDSAFAHFKRASQHPLNAPFSGFNATMTANMGAYQLDKGNRKEATRLLEKALFYADSLKMYPLQYQILENLYRIDQQSGNIDAVIRRHAQMEQARNKIQKAETQNILARNQIERDLIVAEYNFELLTIENEAQKQKIKSQFIRQTLIGSLLAASLVFMVILSIQYRSKTLAYRKLVSKNKEIRAMYTEQLEAMQSIAHQNSEDQILEDHTATLVLNRLEQMMKVERKFLDPEISVTNLAQELGITRHRFSGILSSRLKTNFNEYINNFRILEAQRLLSDVNHSNLTVKAVSEMCGFKSERTFYNAFKQVTGVTPSMYQNL